MQYPATTPAITHATRGGTRLPLPLSRLALLAVTAATLLLMAACTSSNYAAQPSDRSGESSRPPDRPDEPDVYAEVWSQTSPAGSSYEFKVNCAGEPKTLEPCYLSDLQSVRVVGPDGVVYGLDKDFNINDYSGEVTRRWVLYGPEGGLLPVAGPHTFEYLQPDQTVRTQVVDYTPSQISYPTGVEWERVGDDIAVRWEPPTGVEEGMSYKVIIWNESGTPDTFVSQVFDWNDTSATLASVPLVDGGTYSMNVAVYYSSGYAYSRYEIFDW